MVGSHIPRENSWDVECICRTLHIQIRKDWECVIQESDRDKGRVTETASLEWPLSMQQYLAKHFTSWAALVPKALGYMLVICYMLYICYIYMGYMLVSVS